ncbi:hypothetical protein H4R19_006271, partial [Coemansia spiralis]
MAALALLLIVSTLVVLWQGPSGVGWTTGAFILASVAAAEAVYRTIYALYFSPLRRVPGSLIARLTGKRIELDTVAGNMSRLGKVDFERYGDVFVVTPNAVAICNPDDIRALLSNPCAAKADYYQILRFTGIDNTVSAQDFDLANTRHRQMGPFFKPTYLAKMEPVIMEH